MSVLKNEQSNIQPKVNEDSQIINLKNEIEKLKNQLEKYKNYKNLENNNEKLILINFNSEEKQINYPIICKESTKFFELFNELNITFPELSSNENNIAFKTNGNEIQIFKTLKENGILAYDINLSKKN